jgi:hypothetical protein
MILRILSSLLVAVCVLLGVVTQDNLVRQHIAASCRDMLESTLGCQVSLRVRSCNFFIPEVELEDVRLAGTDDQGNPWQWRCKRYRAGFSWAHVLSFGMIDFFGEADDVHIYSVAHGQSIAIAGHIQKLLAPPALPLPSFLKMFAIHRAQILMCDPVRNISVSTSLKSMSRKIHDRFRTTVYVTDGSIHSSHNVERCSRMRGTFTCDLKDTLDGPRCALKCDSYFYMPQWRDHGGCFVSGVWEWDHGRFSLYNADHSCAIDPVVITLDNGRPHVRAQARVQLESVLDICNVPSAAGVAGSASLSFTGTCDEQGRVACDLDVACEDVTVAHSPYRASCTLSCAKRNDDIKAMGTVRLHGVGECSLRGRWDHTQKNGECLIHNSTALELPSVRHWKILPHDFRVSLVGSLDRADAQYAVQCTHLFTHETACHEGLMLARPGEIQAQGWWKQGYYQAHVQRGTQPHSDTLVCFKDDGSELLRIKHDVHDAQSYVAAVIQFPLIRAFMGQMLGYDVQGDGTVKIGMRIGNNTPLMADVLLTDAAIRLPQTYNFVDGMRAHVSYDSTQRKVLIDDFICSLHTGRVGCAHAAIYFDPYGALSYASVPFVFDRCLLNMQHDLFAMVSGALLFCKHPQAPAQLSGSITIDRAQLKENPLSHVLQKRLFEAAQSNLFKQYPDLMCDVAIESKEPVRIDTSFMQTRAHVDVHIARSIFDPRVSGNIKLSGGTLTFPYKPLLISRGSIQLVPDQLNDPLVDLVAKNRIKKFDVTLCVSGSLTNHEIHLSASPTLSDEQIMALLLVGSHDESLNAMMPALVMNNLKNVLFSTNQSTHLERWFKSFTKPFSITLVPSFSDQSGRGGLRGAVEIDVNDRLKAIIQKNFSLSEDTRFEVEYTLSDDITIRGIRDERRDFGGEVEMRWKF